MTGKRTVKPGMLHRWRNYFLTGLVVAAPVFITIYLTWSFIGFVDANVKPLIPSIYNPDNYLPFSVPGIGVVFAFLFLVFLGWVTAKTFGRSIITWGERQVERMPVVRTIYNGLKQIMETVLAQQDTSFQKVGLIQYPRNGLWAIVFVTADTKGEIVDHLGQPAMSVFLPTTPNPTSGFLLFVPKEDVIILDMTVEAAAKLVISGGLVNPPTSQKPAVVPIPATTPVPAAAQTAAPVTASAAVAATAKDRVSPA